MERLTENWFSRTLIILVISCLVAWCMYYLEFTDWATAIDATPIDNNAGREGQRPAQALLYILPFIKEVVLIGVPLALTVLTKKLYLSGQRLISARKPAGTESV